MLTYEEYLETNVEIDYVQHNEKCFYCNKPGLFKCGDSRYFFPACEEHAHMKESYEIYLKKCNLPRSKPTRCEEILTKLRSEAK